MASLKLFELEAKRKRVRTARPVAGNRPEAARLREAGMTVIGFGEKKTPKPFISACDKFIYLEILKGKGAISEEPLSHAVAVSNVVTEPLNKLDKEIIRLITDSVDDLGDENGWAFLGSLGNFLLKKKPDFDPRNYGFNKLLPLIKSLDQFEIDVRDTGVGNIRHVFVRHK